MNKLETLVVPEDLGVLLQDMNIGKSRYYFGMIDALFHYWDNTVGSPIGDFIFENKKELIEIILGSRGYRVEKPKYNVHLKVRTSSGAVGIFLYKQGDEVLAGDNFRAYYQEKDKFRLTEQEIKNYDERFWPFAEPVE